MDSERINKIGKLLGDRHPEYCAGLRFTSGTNNFTEKDILILPNDESALAPKAQAAKAYHRELMASSCEALDQLIVEAFRLAEEEKEAAHPFNIPSAMANDDVYDYWSKAAYWNLEEAIALVMGRNPAKVITKTRLRGAGISSFRPQTCGSKYKALYELGKRAIAMKQVFQQSRPGTFLAWAKRNRIVVPERLEVIVKQHGHQVADWKTVFDKQVKKTKTLEVRIDELEALISEAPSLSPSKSQSAVTRERNTLLKLIIGLVIAGYKHDPNAARSTTTAAIRRDLETLGMTLDEDTIRKILREAAEFAPDTTTE